METCEVNKVASPLQFVGNKPQHLALTTAYEYTNIASSFTWMLLVLLHRSGLDMPTPLSTFKYSADCHRLEQEPFCSIVYNTYPKHTLEVWFVGYHLQQHDHTTDQPAP